MGDFRDKIAHFPGAIMMRFTGQYGLIFAVAIMPACAAARDRSAPASVVGNPAAFFSPNAYPPDAIRARQQGRIVASIAIDPDGHATRCDVTTSSNSPSLDAATCAIAMSRMKYTAARNAAGDAVAGSYELKVRWVLPEPPAGANMALVTFGGTAENPTCAVTVGEHARRLVPALCHAMAAEVQRRNGTLSQPVYLDIVEGMLEPDTI